MSKKSKKDDVLGKVKKLLRLADPANGGTPAEAALAASRAKQLMDKHSIEVAEVTFTDDETIVHAKVDIHQEDAYAWIGIRDYMSMLGFVVADITTTRFLLYKRNKSYRYRGKTRTKVKDCITFIGDKTDVAVAVATYKILIKSVHDWVKKEIGPGYGKSQRSYCEGFVEALWVKVHFTKSDEQVETTALVLVNKKDQIDKYVDEEIQPIQENKNRPKPSDDDLAKMAGYDRGMQENIITQNLVE